jgi:hypothetical protein
MEMWWFLALTKDSQRLMWGLKPGQPTVLYSENMCMFLLSKVLRLELTT